MMPTFSCGIPLPFQSYCTVFVQHHVSYHQNSSSMMLFSKQLYAIPSTSTYPMIIQAVIPVRHGGLGIRSAVQLAPSAFLGSAAASSSPVHQVLPPQFSDTDLPSFQEALTLWTNSCNQSPPEGIAFYHQKSWDIPTIQAINDLLNPAADEPSKSRLLAAFAEESGIRLNALPLSSLGLRMDDSTFQIAISLRLGLAFCKPYCCHHCG